MKDLLIISGFDPSGGAGALRDKDIASRLAVSSDTILSSLTVQNYDKFDSFYSPNISYFTRSLDFLGKYKAIKMGLITDINIAKSLYKNLIKTEKWQKIKFKVLDPILKASAGKSFFWNNDLLDFMLSNIIPNFDIITPNKKEASFLAKKLGLLWNTDKELTKKLSNKLKVSIFMTGGDEKEIIDYFYDLPYDKFFIRKAEKIILPPKKEYLRHGTGCIFSTALACFFINEYSLFEAGKKAAKMVEQSLYIS